ncbi:TPA: hypothetical protein ACFON3_001436 [Neisseria meningitidis]
MMTDLKEMRKVVERSPRAGEAALMTIIFNIGVLDEPNKNV